MKRKLHYNRHSIRFLFSVLVGILMLAPKIMQAQSNGGGATGKTYGSRAEQVPSLRSSSAQVRLNGTEYTWGEMFNHLNNTDNQIEVLQNINVTNWPDKPCTFFSNEDDKKSLGYVELNEDDGQYYYSRLSMSAPMTFKNLTVGIYQIVGNGHALTFDEGVECEGSNMSSSGQTVTGINNIWAGSSESNVETTNLTIKSGTFNWIYGGSGNTGKTGTTNVTITGGTICGELYGGSFNGECRETNVTVSGGTAPFVYGAGFKDKVGTTHVTISGGHITGSVYGGGNGDVATKPNPTTEYSICDNTNVTVSGGQIGNQLYGGGCVGKVTGKAKTNITGGIIVSGVYGGGGQYNSVYDQTTATCGSTDITVSTVRVSGQEARHIYAGGGCAAVLGEAKLTLAGNVDVYQNDKQPSVYASGEWASCDSAEIIIAAADLNNIVSVLAKTANNGSSVTNKCKLTFRGLGSSSTPYTLPWKIEGFDMITLDNTYLTTSGNDNIFVVDTEKPALFKGTGLTAPIGINTTAGNLTAPQILFTAEATTLPAVSVFTGIGNLNGKYIFKANNTYRLTALSSDQHKTITFSTPSTVGDTLKVKLGGTELLSGDKIPVNTELDILTVSKDNYLTEVKDAEDNDKVVGSSLTVVKDVNLSMTIIPYLDLATQKEDVTISQAASKWKYTAAPITRSTPTTYNFNGTVKNKLDDGKVIVIDGTSQGTLTFDNAQIDANSVTGAALTIKHGAQITIKGNLEVKTANANGYAIENKGTVTVDKETGSPGAATTSITATNTGAPEKGVSVAPSASLELTGEGVTLTTTGITNEGTVVAKEGSTATNSSSSGDLLKTYLVTVTDPNNSNKIILKASDIGVVDGDKVTAKTVLTVSGIAASGYTLKEITATTSAGTDKITSGSTYTMPEKEVTFAATFEKNTTPDPTPDPTVFHTVTLPAVEGAVTDPVSGDYQVESWGSFRFHLTLNKEYDQSVPVVTTDLGETITPRSSDGAYIIKYIRSDVKISISGIVKNPDPVGNETVDTSSSKVWAANGYLHIQSATENDAYIYTTGGKLQTIRSLKTGEQQSIQLSSGIYLIRIGNDSFKVVM